MTLRKTIAIAAAATKIRQQIATDGVRTVAVAPPVEMRWVSLSPIPVSTTSQTTPTIDPQAGTARSTSGAQAYAQAANVAGKPRFDCPNRSAKACVTAALR